MNNDILGDGWTSHARQTQQQSQGPPRFAWSTATSSAGQMQAQPSSAFGALDSFHVGSRAITPDHTLNSFTPLSPAPRVGNTMTMGAGGFNALKPLQSAAGGSNPWASTNTASSVVISPSLGHQSQITFSIPSPAPSSNSAFSSFSIAPPPSGNVRTALSNQMSGAVGMGPPSTASKPLSNDSQMNSAKKGLDAYQSLI